MLSENENRGRMERLGYAGLQSRLDCWLALNSFLPQRMKTKDAENMQYLGLCLDS